MSKLILIEFFELSKYTIMKPIKRAIKNMSINTESAY